MATYDIKPRLNRLDGVSTVIVQGGEEPEFQISPDPAKLLADPRHRHRYSRCGAAHEPDRFSRPARTQPPAFPGTGQCAGAHARKKSANIVVKTTKDGVPVRIQEVATVRPSVKPVYTIVTADTKPAVLLSVNRQPDSNTVQVAQEVHDEIAQIQKTLPHGVRLQPVL